MVDISYKPLYLRIGEEIAEDIKSGKISPCQKVYSIREMCQKFNVSHITARRVAAELLKEGLIFKVNGKGTFASDFSEKRMRTKLSSTVGLVIADNRDHFLAPIIREIENVLFHKGWEMVLSNSQADYGREEKIILSLWEKGKVDGLIIEPCQKKKISSYLYWLKKRNFPLVIMGQINAVDAQNFNYVICDDEFGAYMATKHLIDLGHERIIYVSHKDINIPSNINRLNGYRQAMEDKDLPAFEPIIWRADILESRTEEPTTLDELLLSPERPTALFCYNDTCALDSIRIIKELGLYVPQDVAIVGFDNREFAEYGDTPLTTVEYPSVDVGRIATDILLRNIKGESEKLSQITVRPRLIVRESSGVKEGANVSQVI